MVVLFVNRKSTKKSNIYIIWLHHTPIDLLVKWQNYCKDTDLRLESATTTTTMKLTRKWNEMWKREKNTTSKKQTNVQWVELKSESTPHWLVCCVVLSNANVEWCCFCINTATRRNGYYYYYCIAPHYSTNNNWRNPTNSNEKKEMQTRFFNIYFTLCNPRPYGGIDVRAFPELLIFLVYYLMLHVTTNFTCVFFSFGIIIWY